jgi:predicted alpha/beta-fold hydrolase
MIENKRNVILQGTDNRPILIDITNPKQINKKKVIVFSHGFKGFKDWGPFNHIAKEFAFQGFTLVKFNFSHNGTTIEDPTNFGNLEAFGNNNFCKELDDLGFVLDWVENNLNPNEISLFGHSRGGGISMLKTVGLLLLIFQIECQKKELQAGKKKGWLLFLMDAPNRTCLCIISFMKIALKINKE